MQVEELLKSVENNRKVIDIMSLVYVLLFWNTVHSVSAFVFGLKFYISCTVRLCISFESLSRE